MENYDLYKSHSNDKHEYKIINEYRNSLFEYYKNPTDSRYSILNVNLFGEVCRYEFDLVVSELLTENFNTRVNLQNPCLVVNDNSENIIAVISYIDTHIDCFLIKITSFYTILKSLSNFTSITTDDELQINILTSHFPHIKIINPSVDSNKKLISKL
jgi:hypothetical protein